MTNRGTPRCIGSSLDVGRRPTVSRKTKPATVTTDAIAVAVEKLITSELKPWRLALVFSFGLLHGMGFAGVWRDLGLPRSAFLTALVTFNVGVEAGQLLGDRLGPCRCGKLPPRRRAYRRFVV